MPPSAADDDVHVIAAADVFEEDDDHLLRAPAIRFTVGATPRAAKPEDARRLIFRVDAALAQRAGGPDVEALEISFVYSSDINRYFDYTTRYSFPHPHAADITLEHVGTWLRFAARRVTKCFTLEVTAQLRKKPVLPRKAAVEVRAGEEEQPVLHVELPASARAEVMSLTIRNAGLALPAAGTFHALTDLLL